MLARKLLKISFVLCLFPLSVCPAASRDVNNVSFRGDSTLPVMTNSVFVVPSCQRERGRMSCWKAGGNIASGGILRQRMRRNHFKFLW